MTRHALFDSGSTVPKIVQALLGIGTCLLTWSIARRLLSARAALLAGIIVAYWGPLLFFSAQLLPTALIVFLFMASL